MKKSKPVFAWCLKHVLGELRLDLLVNRKSDCVEMLKESFRVGLYTIVRVKITEVPPQRGSRRGRRIK